jgi:serine/threonine-protein kinase
MMFSGPGRIGDMELVLLFVVSGIAAVLALASAGRTLMSRWRSAPAVDRLAGIFAAAAVSLLAVAGLITIGLSDYALVGPPPDGTIMPYVEVGTFVLPFGFAFLVFFLGIRRGKT